MFSLSKVFLEFKKIHSEMLSVFKIMKGGYYMPKKKREKIVYTRYITKNGVRIYPKKGKVFRFIVKE